MNSRYSTDPAAFFMNIIMGFWLAPTLWLTVRFKLPERLAETPKNADELAGDIGVDSGHLRRILNALSSAGIFQRLADGRYGPTEYSLMLRSDHPSGIAQLIDTALGGQNFLAWSSLEDAVRTGGSAFDIQHGMDWLQYLDRNPERRDIFATAMTATTRATEQAVLSHDFGQFEQVVDIGGSHASLVGRLLEQYPQAQGIVFDLPDTVEAGKKTWQSAAFADRLTAVGGDFFKAVPEGDLYLLKLILHDWQDDDAVAILSTIRKSIRPGGRVAIIETVLPDDCTPHLGWALDIAMMVTTGGRERSLAEHSELLRRAGFEVIRCDPTPSMYSVVEARPV